MMTLSYHKNGHTSLISSQCIYNLKLPSVIFERFNGVFGFLVDCMLLLLLLLLLFAVIVVVSAVVVMLVLMLLCGFVVVRGISTELKDMVPQCAPTKFTPVHSVCSQY